MKHLRLAMMIALLVAGFAAIPAREVTAADCLETSGGHTNASIWGPLEMIQGTTIDVALTADPANGTFIRIYAHGVNQVYSIQTGS